MHTECTIRCDGREFYLTIPAVRGERQRTITLPVDRPDLLANILREQARQDTVKTIGAVASPTQRMIEVYVQEHGVAKCATSAETRATAKQERLVREAEEMKERLGGLEIVL